MSGFISSISIRAKLITAFALLLAGTIGLGLFAVERLDGVNAVVADLQNNWLPATRGLGDMARATERFRMNQALLVTDPESGRPDRIKLIRDQSDVFRAAFSKYEATIPFDPPAIIVEEKRLARDIASTWAVYTAMSTKFEDLISLGKQDEVIAFTNNEMKAAMAGLREALTVDLDFQVREGDKAGALSAAFGQSTHTWILIFLGAMAALCVGAGWSLIHAISAPIVRMTIAMRTLANRDMTAVVPEIGRGDEIGSMAAAVQVFKENMILTERLTADQESTKTATAVAQKTAMTRTADGFQAKVGNLVALLSAGATELEATARSMSGTATHANGQASRVAMAAEEASAGVETVASAAEELTASINEISRQVTQSSKITRQAVANAQRTDTIVRTLAEGAERIGHVVGLISNIAGQTNLLANMFRKFLDNNGLALSPSQITHKIPIESAG